MECIFSVFNSNRSGRCHRGATHNIAEVQAVNVAIEQACQLAITNLRVNTDSNMVYTAITENLSRWKANGLYSMYNGQPISDRADYEKLDHAISYAKYYNQMTIRFQLSLGRSDNQHLNEADRLAAAGARLHN